MESTIQTNSPYKNPLSLEEKMENKTEDDLTRS